MMYDYTKAALKAKGLLGTGLCRANVTGCLGRCEEGPCLVVYPEGVWYTYQTTADLDEIIETHVSNNGLVERLLLEIKPEIQA